jgi:hypothetical protein
MPLFNSPSEINQRVKRVKREKAQLKTASSYLRVPLMLEEGSKNSLDCKFISHNLFAVQIK